MANGKGSAPVDGRSLQLSTALVSGRLVWYGMVWLEVMCVRTYLH